MKNQFLRLLALSLITGYFALNTSGTLCAQTVTIGSQVWMVKNLNVAGFRNGDAIPEAKSDDAWREAGNNNQSAWCWYDNDPANGAKFGRLYNWYAVADPRGLCPAGWHVPSDEDWTVLENKLGGRNIAGEKMKASGGWKSYETKGRTKTCPNCASWSMEYRRKVPCHTCKDTRSINAPMVMTSGNGSNSSGFTGLPGGYRFDFGTCYLIGRR